MACPLSVAFLRDLSLSLICLILVSGQVRSESIDQQRISPVVLDALQKDFQMSEAITLIQQSQSRSSSRRHLQEQKRFNFMATQSQGPMIVDGYSAGDLESSIVGYSLFYHGSNGPLLVVDASVNPMNSTAQQVMIGLLNKSLDSVSNPDGSSMHFLGIYDFDSSRVLKIMIRQARTPMGPDYAIRYTVSQR
jgi:hypothetical protein